MQKYSKIIALFLIFLLFSCSSSKSQNDSDMMPDADADSDDIETVDDDSDSQDSEIADDSDEIPDQDADHDTPEKVECLDLRYNENTIKTPFPFKDANGKPTFCRPGCDTPTENDPQCVRNIWEWDNWEEYQVYLKAQKENPNQTKERECYPWPCKLPDMHAKTKTELSTFVSSCDRLLTVNEFRANVGTINSHGMSDGIAGMDFGHSGRATEYDPEKDEYKNIGQSAAILGFNENRYVVAVYDRKLTPDDYPDPYYKSFVISISKNKENYKYELVYDNEYHDAFLMYPPLSGQKWVLIQVISRDHDSKLAVKYASSKDWDWHELAGIENYAGEGNIVGDHLTFITNNRELYYCDLRKYPKHIDECFKLNRKNESGEEELGHSPRIDLENEYRVVYNVYGKPVFVEVDLNDLKNPKYTEYKIEKTQETSYSWQIDMLKGNMISYSDFFTLSAGTVDNIGCFYRFDKQKTYSQKNHTFTTYSGDELMGYNVFWGKWHLWKMTTRPDAIMRDWECYCEETGICPLEPATEEELAAKKTHTPSSLRATPSSLEGDLLSAEILERIEQEKILPKFDGNEVYFCGYTERFLMNVGNPGSCPTAVQMNNYLKHPDKSDQQLKDLILASKRQWKTEKSFEDLLKNHKKIWNQFHSCDIHESFVCEYNEETSTFDSDSVMFATVIDQGRARDGIFFRDRFYEANGNFPKVIKELREKFGASLRGRPRIEVKENK